VNTKFRNIREEYEESNLKENFNNQESSREQSSESRSRSETSKLNANNQNSNNREMSQNLASEQVNALICYNCDKSDHIARRCSAFRKMNFNSVVREIDEDQSDEENLETSRKE
jgi:predicted phage gp36 major capsid-like protein